MSELFGFVPTNTLDSVSFDVLAIDGVEDPMIDVNKLTNMELNESYFLTAVKHICEARDSYAACKNTLYTTIAEATNSAVVLEGFSDFFSKVKQIIDKFLKFIKSLFQRFITNLNKLVGSESYLKKHKKLLDDFTPSDKFEFDGYEYTFSPNIPNPSVALDFEKNIFDPFIGMGQIGDTVDITANGVASIVQNLNYDNDYDSFRATVIGRDGEKVYESEFSDALFRVFRNGADTTDKIEADRSYVMQAKNRFFNFSSAKSSAESEYKRIESAYKQLEKQVNDVVRRNGDLNTAAFIDRLPENIKASDIKINGKEVSQQGVAMSADLMKQIDVFVKQQVDRIQEYSNIHTLAFAAKLDALKEATKQDKNTLYVAISKIQRTDSKRKED